MRGKMVTIWRKIQRSKRLEFLIQFITWLIDTEIFNISIDFLERHTNRAKLQETYKFYTENRTRIKKNIKCLEDEKSKRVYLNVIKYRCSLKRKYLSHTSPMEEKYFDSQIVRFKKNEILIDCGAFTGDTALLLEEKWINWDVKGALLQLCCWEPDEYNIIKLEKTLSMIAARHSGFLYRIVKKAAWKENSELSFDGGVDYASKIDERGGVRVQAAPIDEIASELGEVSFIKMDIEGAELEALEGAKQTITNYHPTMAVCIYHTNEQMLSLIEFFRKTYPFYKLYVRHYARAWTETVLYAIETD